ncbi:maleylacetoacetate isomerase [Massilia atriviolacea]|uniref:Maleylacetoacetate isomerase n=1 Tax=Massilia atriviolacea TaxID=2495579 RepID=A0A430HJV5_9BURK|nr:maleylacetoacetate isomerase [Massilia atriviolacea]RSZ57808.1 maleylacetoacetate isomerase [Massilia atriviolacea]
MKLYTYFRSSAAYRVRIALNLKGVGYEAVPVHLLRNGGEQRAPEYLAINPSGLVPSLQDKGTTLTQSIAILEYLEEVHPQVALLPRDALGRARVRSLALMVACDIHPLTNLRVLRHLVHQVGLPEEAKTEWYVHWLREGMAAIEAHLAHSPDTGRFCHGDTPTMADCCLVPQVFNARRFHVDLAPYPTIARIDAMCAALPAFAEAHPSRQPDAE